MPWFWDLVTMFSQIIGQPAQSADSAVPSDPAQEPLEPESSPRALSIMGQGFCEAKWTIFTKWCHSNQVDFRAPPVKFIADFLLFLFQDKNSHPRTIDGYRSAIANWVIHPSMSAKMKISLVSWIASTETDLRV